MLRSKISASYALPSPEEEEGDQTGDSGIGTGSGTTRYGTVAEWKKAIQNPPPGIYVYITFTF